MEERFAERLAAAGLAPAAEVQSSRKLQAEMTGAGLPMTLAEIVVRRGLVDAATCRSIWLAAGGAPLPDLPGPDPRLDRRAADRALASGALTREGLANIEAFRAWAASRGLTLGMAEILVRRGFLSAGDLAASMAPPAAPTRARPAEAPPARDSQTRRPPRAPTTRVQEMRRAGSPSPRDLEPPATGRVPIRSRPAPPVGRGRSSGSGGSSRGLALGIGIGAAVTLLVGIVLAIVLSGGDGTPAPVPPATTDARPVRPDPVPIDPPPRTDPGLDMTLEIEELAVRIRGLVREARLDEATREVEAFRRALPDDATRRRCAAELDELAATVAQARERIALPAVDDIDLLRDLDAWKLINVGAGSRVEGREIVVFESGTNLMASLQTDTIDLGRRFALGFEFRGRFQGGRTPAIFVYFEADPARTRSSESALILVPDASRGTPHVGFARQVQDGKQWIVKETGDIPGGALDSERWYRFEVAWDESTRRLVVRLDGRTVLEVGLTDGDVLKAPWGIGMGELPELRVRRMTLRRG